MRIFDVNGPLMSALGKLADIVICNILFCLFSLPVITIGASLTALFSCMQQLVTDEERDEGLIFQSFWRAFRQNFGQATLLWLVCLLAIAFLGAYYWVIRSLGGPLARIYQVTFYLLTLVFLFGFLYIFPLQARFQNRVRDTLRNAWLLSVAALPWTLLSLLVIAAAVYLSFFMDPNAVAMAEYLWAVCGFALVAYLDSFFFRKAFQKIAPPQAEQETAVAEGALFTDEAHRKDDLMVQESSYSDPNWNRREEPKTVEHAKRRKRR
ncbi:MAG: DUF624 domain-containing protein [Oscillospiraceae bacterium]|nr:DUF624 domain-containing protein [Oscillospiraceae bacterium]